MATRYFKRGNETVNLDSYIRNLESNIDGFLQTAQVYDGKNWRLMNNDEQNQVRKTYASLLQEINQNPDKVIYQLGNDTFQNSIGINNLKNSGVDTNGVAATFMGRTLRNMPVEIENTGRTRYSKNSPIFTPDNSSYIFGTDPSAFIELDPVDEATGKRSRKTRTSKTIERLRAFQAEANNRFDFDNEEDKQDFMNRINSAIAVLENDNSNDDLYALNLLGLDGLSDYFSTEGTVETSTDTSSDENASENNASENNASEEKLEENQKIQDAKDFMKYIQDNYNPSASLQNPISIGNTTLKFNGVTTRLWERAINNLSKKTLSNFVDQLITAGNNPNLRRDIITQLIYGTEQRSVDPNLAFNTLLEILKKKKLLVPFGNNSGKYYLRYSAYNNKTAWVWDENDRQLKNMRLIQIPYWRNKITQEYQANNQAAQLGDYADIWKQFTMKNGGVLKAELGLQLNIPDISENYSPLQQTWLDQQNPLAKDVNLPSPSGWYKATFGNGNYTGDTILTGYDPSKSTSRRTITIGAGTNHPGLSMGSAYDIQRKYWESGKMIPDVVDAYKDWKTSNPSGSYQQFVDYYNGIVDQVRALTQQKMILGHNNNGFGDLYDKYNWLYRSRTANYNPQTGTLGKQEDLKQLLGPTNWSRNALWFGDDNLYSNLRNGSFVDTDVTSRFRITNDGHLELIPSNENTSSNETNSFDRDKVSGIQTNIGQPVNIVDSSNKLLERFLNYGIPSLNFGTALAYNKKIGDIIDKGISLVSYNPPARHSNVRDDLSTRRLGEQEIADAQSRASRPLFSDADKALAYMTQMQNNSAKYRLNYGLKADEMIEKTRQNALLNEMWTGEQRASMANANRQQFPKYNAQKAENKAKVTQGEYESIKNFLKDIYTNASNENIKRQNAIQQQNALNIQNWYNNQINDLNQKFIDYQLQHPGATEAQFNVATGGAYARAKADLSKDVTNLGYLNSASILGINTDELAKQMKWFSLSNYNLSV